MHLYIATRGQKIWVDDFINSLQGQYLPYQASPHQLKTEPNFLQIGVRPLQLWELAFPEDQLPVMLNTLQGSEFRTDDKRWLPSFIGYILKLKSLLGLKDIPKDWDKSRKLLVRKDPALDIKYIGIKKDQYGLTEMV